MMGYTFIENPGMRIAKIINDIMGQYTHSEGKEYRSFF